MNVLVLLQMAAEAMPDRQAFCCDGQSLTYAELYRASGRAAKRFTGSRGDYVAYYATSGLAAPIALFGAAAAGKPYVPLNYRLTDAEIGALLARINPCYLVAESQPSAVSRGESAGVCTPEQLLDDCLSATEPGPDPWLLNPDDVVVQLFTSGTTGQPKAAVLRHRNLASYILGSVEFAAADDEDAVLVTVPPYHIAGISALLSSVYSGRRVVLLPNFSPEEWLTLCASERVSNAFVVPTMLARILDVLDSQSCELPMPTALRSLAYGGGKMPQVIIERAMQAFPDVAFTNAYGLTETSSTITLLSPEDHLQAFQSVDEHVRKRLSSVGRALPGVELDIRDSEGSSLAAGECGEIYVRGDQVSGEYVGRGSLLDSGGWFPTRDAGYLDDEGYLFLDGRADDVIVRGGENISPGEIEDVLVQHPAVADVAVLGVPSTEWGEAVVAAVVLKDGEAAAVEALQALVKDRLRSSRVPERILYLDQLPYNEMGKLLRRQIKSLFERAVNAA